MLRNVQIWAVLSCYKIDLLMFRNRVFSVRNVQIWVVLSSNLVDLVIPRNRFFRLRNGEIFSSLSLKRVVLLMLRNSVFKQQIFQIRVLPSARGWLATSQISCFILWNVHICAVTCYKSTIYWLWGSACSVFENFRYVKWWHETTSICWSLGIAVSGLEIFIYEYCCHA